MDEIKIKLSFILCAMLIHLSATAHVNLKSPKGGENFFPGESVKIEWKVAIAHDTKNWDLYFSTDGGKTYEVIKLDIDVKALSYDWSVPYISTKTARIKIVMDNTEDDYSDESGDFTIAGTSTASADLPEHSGIRLFPNPASDHVHINSSALSPPIQNIWVFDDLGRVMDSLIPVREVSGKEYNMDVSHWPPGFYFMVVKIGEDVEIGRLIIQ